jgi:hypothetical protein
MRIDSSGNVGIGESSPSSYDSGARNLVVGSNTHTGILIKAGTSSYSNLYFGDGTGSASYSGFIAYNHNENTLRVGANGSEALRIDSSRRLLVGASSSVGNSFLQIQGDAANSLNGGSLLLRRGEHDGHISAGEALGHISFSENGGGVFGTIECEADGAAGTNSYPGRLIFATTATNNQTPTERMRIDNLGNVTMSTVSGGQEALTINRVVADGTLISFKQGGTTEGDIAVSGSTISYNGGHLTRWSQLPGNAERITILRGTVLSNIDEMCEWGDEDNEQLNRMKVSEVEGDPNVAGVFQSWDDSDEVYTNDFYCAMTGDFIIRIAQGTTVARGDLLMSAGDGTAKPQDDDIVRSKTIAKVTSTNVTCTYADGSYCVPCVLMAC